VARGAPVVRVAARASDGAAASSSPTPESTKPVRADADRADSPESRQDKTSGIRTRPQPSPRLVASSEVVTVTGASWIFSKHARRFSRTSSKQSSSTHHGALVGLDAHLGLSRTDDDENDVPGFLYHTSSTSERDGKLRGMV